MSVASTFSMNSPGVKLQCRKGKHQRPVNTSRNQRPMRPMRRHQSMSRHEMLHILAFDKCQVIRRMVFISMTPLVQTWRAWRREKRRPLLGPNKKPLCLYPTTTGEAYTPEDLARCHFYHEVRRWPSAKKSWLAPCPLSTLELSRTRSRKQQESLLYVK